MRCLYVLSIVTRALICDSLCLVTRRHGGHPIGTSRPRLAPPQMWRTTPTTHQPQHHRAAICGYAVTGISPRRPPHPPHSPRPFPHKPPPSPPSPNFYAFSHYHIRAAVHSQVRTIDHRGSGPFAISLPRAPATATATATIASTPSRCPRDAVCHRLALSPPSPPPSSSPSP